VLLRRWVRSSQGHLHSLLIVIAREARQSPSAELEGVSSPPLAAKANFPTTLAEATELLTFFGISPLVTS
jgi:hypothetical protein